MRRFGLFLIVLIVVLVVFNPGMSEFKTFVREQAAERIQQEAGEGVLGRVLSGAGSELAASGIERATERHNYFVFSLYDVDLDGAPSTDPEYQFLGFGGRFFVLETPEHDEAR